MIGNQVGMRIPLTLLLLVAIIAAVAVRALHTVESIRTQSNLISALEQAKGIYNDANKARQAGVSNAVVVTACNYGFINHLYNFDCFMKRLDMKYVVFAMDQRAYYFLKNHTNLNVVDMQAVQYNPPVTNHDEERQSVMTAVSQEFRSKHFNLITAKKKEIVHDIMLLGYDVLFSDTDVAIVRDPLPYMLWKNVDYVHSLNAICFA
jgi:hypothetical protein